RAPIYDRAKRWEPDRPMVGNENWNQWHEWKAILDRPFIAGMFTWTGIDYMGEANAKWPVKGTGSGMLDVAGFEKPSFHFMRSIWSDTPATRLFTQRLADSRYDADGAEREPGAWRKGKWFWYDVARHWQYEPGESVIVEAYSNRPQLELKLNGKSLGVKRLEDFEDRVYRWCVPYEPGELTVEGDHLATPGEPAAVRLSLDHTHIPADGRSVVHGVAQIVDVEGRPVTTEEHDLRVDINGPLRLLGVDNGANDNVQPFQSDRITTAHGRCLFIAQATDVAGQTAITVSSTGLASARVTVQTGG
ncbi:MAG: DUF4982 domain-containing protein, partial [Planctomycetota bacterium]